jgi:outer membrane receptor protein involved in Fe transport
MTVTATRDLREVFQTPVPVSVVDSTQLAQRGHDNISDFFLDLPGLDLNGVGPNQVRPVIRGQLGQRILLLEDGLRMNNSRRQSDFGEIPSLVPLEDLERVEVVRGPASVLYGTDAIGGAVNLITRPELSGTTGSTTHGSLGFRYSDVDQQPRPWGMLNARAGQVTIQVFGAWRDAQEYTSPGGSFGNVKLAGDTKVIGSGVQDENYSVDLGLNLTENQRIFARYEGYTANNAGFGYVSNADLGTPDAPTIDIRYPTQAVDKVTLGYGVTGMRSAIADKLSVTGYFVSNERRLHLNAFIPFGPGTPPGAGLDSRTQNFTNVDTWGFRVEAATIVATRHRLTYGVDGFQDNSENTDTVTNTVVGFGPPQTQVSTTPQVPNAYFRSLGAFTQMDFAFTDRLDLIAGVRVQDVKAATRETPGLTNPDLSNSDVTAVGAVNASYLLTGGLSAIGTVGRGFRSPNLVERFFNGPVPEVQGFQSATPDLKPETSLNVDLGLRYRDRRLSLEAFAFRNEIHDGIRIEATGDTVQGLPEFKNVNVDKLRVTGIEASGTVAIAWGISLGAHYTHLRSKDVLDPNNPVAQSYSDKIGGTVRYDHPSRRFWLAYTIRHEGQQDDVALALSPIGNTLPAFTVMDARAGAALFRVGGTSHGIGIQVTNLTDELYAEPSNASLFRPEARRNVVLSYRLDF